ncbi:MAG: extracellular solute-binding protein [Actinomycetota bacterium]
MKKTLLWMVMLLLITSLVGLLFIGCKEEAAAAEEEEVAEEEVATEEEVAEEEINTEGLPYNLPQYPTDQERDAILAARAIAEEMGDQVTLKLLVSPDNVSDFEPFYPEWEAETGIKIETYTVPWPDWFKELMNLSITKSDKYDVLMTCPQWVPDLAEANVLENLSPFVEKYNPESTDPNSPNSVLPGLRSFMTYNDNYYILFSDTDVATLFLRKDWLEDPNNQAEFESTYGYSLDIPETLEEWKDQLEFFTNPDENRYGMAMSWGIDEVAFDYYPRLVSQKVAFFDDEMHPNINSPEAVQALEEMKENLQFAMPGTLEFDFARALEAYAGGNVYCTLLMTWAQAAFEDPEFSQVVGKTTYAPFPGRIIDGELVNPQIQYWGWGYSVSANSVNKELAYLYCQWMNGAAMNARVALTPGGWYDVNKVSNYDPEQFPEILRENGGMYKEAWMDNQEWQVENCFPPISIKGGSEYSGVLQEAISGALKGAVEPQVALDDVANKWEEITERYGRDTQIESWNNLKSIYSAPVQEWLGF